MVDHPVIVKAFVGRASEPINGVRSLEIYPEYQRLNLSEISFSDNEYQGFIDMSFQDSPLTTMGASWIRYGSYDTEPYPYYLPDVLGFSEYVNRGLEGRRPQDIAREAVSTSGLIPWDTSRRGVVLLDPLGNALIEDDTPLNRTAALEQTRALVALVSAENRVEQTDWAFTGGWADTASAQPYASGGTTAIVNAGAGAYVDIPVTSAPTYVLMHGTDGTTAPGGTFTFTQNGRPLGSKNLNATTIKTDREASNGVAPVVYRLPAHDAGVVRAAYSDNGVSGAYGFLDGLLPQSATPPLIILMKPPRVTAPTHDKPDLYNYLRTIPDILAAEFGKHVVVVDPLPGFDPATMLGADQLHPTRLGTQHMVDAIVHAIHTRSWKLQFEKLFGVSLV